MKNTFLNPVVKCSFAVLLISCEQDTPTLDVSIQNQIDAVNGHLVINSPEEFNTLISKSDPYAKSVFDGKGFTSLLSIYQQAITEETKYFEIMESYSDQELQALFPNGVNPHSDFVNRNSHFLTSMTKAGLN